MNIDLIIECDRCKEKTFTSTKNIHNISVVDIIVKNSSHRRISVFGDYLLLCPGCQESYSKFLEKRKQESENFINNFKE